MVLQDGVGDQARDPWSLRRHAEFGARVLEACQRPRLVLVGAGHHAPGLRGPAEHPQPKITQGAAQSHRENTWLHEAKGGLLESKI